MTKETDTVNGRKRRSGLAGARMLQRAWQRGASRIVRALLLMLLSLVWAGSLPLAGGTASALAPALPRVVLPSGDVAPAGTLQIAVNYGHDWVAGDTWPDSHVYILLRDSEGGLKDEASTVSSPDGHFFADCTSWYSGSCPDIAPGDAVDVENVPFGDYTYVEVIGAWTLAELDDVENTVSAQLHADWLPNPIQAYCEAWPEFGDGAATPAAAVNPSGGTLSCDFDDAGWDLVPTDTVALVYVEPDGDRVYGMPPWPWRRVNIADDWVGASLPAGHAEAISLYDSIGALKATASMAAGFTSDWGSEGYDTRPSDWSPLQPDIAHGDTVVFDSGGVTSTLRVGIISGAVDASTDSVTGNLVAPGETGTLTVECHPWGAWDAGLSDAPVKYSTAAANGTSLYSCTWDPATEWDMQPGQRVAVMYIEPDGDRVIDAFAEPAAYLRLWAGSNSVPSPDGNVRVSVEVRNDGDADAANVTLTAQQVPADGLMYLFDTSSLVPDTGAGTVSWPLGTVSAGTTIAFDVFFEVDADQGTDLTSYISVMTSSFTLGDPAERMAVQEWTVQANDTQLSIGKWAATGRPAAGYELAYGLSVCNNGGTSSSAIVVSDTPGPGQPLQTWWGEQAGWRDVVLSPEVWEGEFPVVDPGQCLSVHPVALLDHGLSLLSPVTNTATLAGGNDLTPEDNETYWEGPVSAPWVNLQVEKTFGGGSLVPGGEVRYEIIVRNEGNIPSSGITITDTVPLGTYFAESWESSFWGPTPLIPDYVDASQVVWEIPELAAGLEYHLGVRLDIYGDTIPGTVIANAVEVSSAAPEVRYDDNVSEAVELVYDPAPNLRLGKTANWWDPQHIHYDVLFDNLGSEIVSDVVITDTLPVGVSCTGDLEMDMDQERIVSMECVPGTPDMITAELTELYPGERHWMGYTVSLDEPGASQLYTNTATISVPPCDPNPADNGMATVSVPPSPLHWVETFVNDRGPSRMDGGAEPGRPVTVTVPSGVYATVADPACGGCWHVDDLGGLEPGDAVTVKVEGGAFPLSLVVPDTFTALADSTTDEVTGEVGAMYYRLVEIHGDWGGKAMTWTAADGSYVASLDDIPPGGTGTIRVEEGEGPVGISWARPLSTLDLILEVNYGHDWVNASYEAGHTATFTVTESSGVTIKATAEVVSQVYPEWGGWTGFATSETDPWVPERPDMEPGDRVFGEVDNGRAAEVQLGEIVGLLDLDADTVAGTISLPGAWEAAAWCAVWVEGGPEVWFDLPTGGDDFVCDLGAAGWDLRHGQDVAVGYVDPAGHRVINVFREGKYLLFLPVVRR